MWTSGISVVSTGSELPGVRGNQYSVSLTTLCTKFENDSIKIYFIRQIWFDCVWTTCADLKCLPNSINTLRIEKLPPKDVLRD